MSSDLLLIASQAQTWAEYLEDYRRELEVILPVAFTDENWARVGKRLRDHRMKLLEDAQKEPSAEPQ